MTKIKALLLVIIFSLILSENTYSHVVLDYPIGGETFQASVVVTLQWHIAISHGPANWNLFFSNDGGSTWEAIVLSLPEAQLNLDWTIPNITTDSGQVKVVQDNVTGEDYYDACSNFKIITTTGINGYTNHSNKYILYSAYPNPFNNSTLISFYLPTISRVQINIYNLLGQKLETVVNKEMSAGINQVRWNANELPSGVYLYMLQAGEYIETKKMILMK